MGLIGRGYTCTFGPTAETAAFDVFELTPADDKPLTIVGCTIGQTTEFGDAQEEELEIKIMRGGTAMTSGSGGTTAANGVSVDATGATSGFTFEAGNTTLATFTSGVTLLEDSMNVRSGWQWWPPPEMWISVSQGNGGLVIRMNSTPADSITFVATLYVLEEG
jgi:hypothetical protein